jgi:outer membrane protein TolC
MLCINRLIFWGSNLIRTTGDRAADKMNFRHVVSQIFLTFIALALSLSQSRCAALAAGREVNVPDDQFQPIRPTHAVTLEEAVQISLRNYPAISNKYFKLRAAKANVSLAKTQYLPNLNVDVQESGITANRVASTVMNNVSGFDTVPVDSGPSTPRGSISYQPIVNNLQGANLNWLLIDCGLRHANDNFAYADARAARADLNLTKLDVAFDAADAYLTAVATKQIILSMKAALDHMEAANLRAKTLVAEGLKPGVDAADFDYEVSKAKIGLIKAEKDRRICLVNLAEKMGVAATDLEIISDPVVRSPQTITMPGPIDLSSHPLALVKTAEVGRWRAKEVVLDKAYRPHLWLNSSVWGRGSGDYSNPIKPVAGGFLPQTFNYMLGVSLSFPVLEYFPLKAQKAMAHSNQMAAKADFDLALQVLEKKDARARIALEQTRKVAEETPVLVSAARVREEKVLKRYSAGLTNMVSLAQAEKALTEAEVEDYVAQIEVWRSILSLAYVQGDLKPFLQVVEKVEASSR